MVVHESFFSQIVPQSPNAALTIAATFRFGLVISKSRALSGEVIAKVGVRGRGQAALGRRLKRVVVVGVKVRGENAAVHTVGCCPRSSSLNSDKEGKFRLKLSITS